MNKKTYTAPEAEIEKFSLALDVIATSGLDDSDNNGTGEGADLDLEF